MIKSVIKLSKKSLSLLIALIMVFSALPLTPPISAEAVETVSAEIKAYVNSNYTKIGTPKGYTSDYGVQANAADGSYTTSSLKNDDKISNVLYTYGLGDSSPYSKTNDIDWTYAGLQYGPIVFMYDGEKDMACPINFFAYDASVQERHIRSFYPTTTGFEFKKNWNSNKSAGQTGYQTTSNNCVSYKSGDKSVNSGDLPYYLGGNYYYFSNTLYCTLKLSDTTYSQTVTSVTYQFLNKSNHTANVEMSTSKLNGNKTYNPNIYIVNYKPIKDRADKIKNAINEILNGKKPDGYYTQESVDAAYNVANLMLKADPTKVDYSKNQQDAVNTAAKAIQDAAEAANAFTGLVHKHSFTGATGAYVNNNDGTHKQKCKYFNICGGYSDNEDHSYTNKYTSGDTAKVECSCGHYYTLNASAYKAAVLAAQASINNEQAYTETSRNELNKVLSEQAQAIKTAITQEAVDNCTSTIVSANQLKTVNDSGLKVGTLEYNKYSITLNYVDEKGADLGTQTITNVNYGTIKEVTAETNFKDKSYVVYKWTRLDKNGDVLSGLNSTSVSVNVVGDLTYYVHLKSTQAESPTNTAVVTLNNKAGKPVDVGYVTTNEPQNVVVNGNTIEIGETTTLTAPQYSFYSVKGFIVNKELITADSGTKSITVTDNMTIIPLYSPKSYVNITRGDGEMFTINGKDTKSYSARWDELITLEATGDVIWYTTENKKDVVLGKGRIFKFRANENIEIYTKQEVASLTPNSRVGYFGYDADLKKVTIVNNFFVPGRANENVKAGVVVSTKAKTKEDMIKQYKAGTLKFEGGYDKFTADKNQIRITINRNGHGDFSMWALSYVIVGETTYFANDVVSYTYNSQSTTA